MFSDRDAISGAEFPSCWKMEISLSEGSCQTMPCTIAETGAQIGDLEEVGCQTEGGEGQERKELDEEALAKFVQKAALIIEDELDAISCSRAYDGFNGYGLEEEDNSEEVTLVKTVDADEGWKVSDMAWNALGSAVVASEVQDHSDWCSHLPRISVYRVDRSGMPQGEKPTQVLTFLHSFMISIIFLCL